MRLSFIIELLLIFVLIAFAASHIIDSKGKKLRPVNRRARPQIRQDAANKYCSCSSVLCNCCREFNIPVMTLKGSGCATLQYLKGDRLALSMSFGDRVLTNTTINSRKPKPICMPLPGGVSKFCGRVYNIQRQGEDFKACLGLELMSLRDVEASLRVSCFRFGPQGLKTEPAQPLPLIQSGNKDEEDEDDDEEDYFDVDYDDDNDIGAFSFFSDDLYDDGGDDDETNDVPIPAKPVRPARPVAAPVKVPTRKYTRKPARAPAKKATKAPTRRTTSKVQRVTVATSVTPPSAVSVKASSTVSTTAENRNTSSDRSTLPNKVSVEAVTVSNTPKSPSMHTTMQVTEAATANIETKTDPMVIATEVVPQFYHGDVPNEDKAETVQNFIIKDDDDTIEAEEYDEKNSDEEESSSEGLSSQGTTETTESSTAQ